MMSEWKPVATAPLDEDIEFLAFDDCENMDVVIYLYTDNNGTPVFYNGDVTVNVTHWMPLPEPPSGLPVSNDE